MTFLLALWLLGAEPVTRIVGPVLTEEKCTAFHVDRDSPDFRFSGQIDLV